MERFTVISGCSGGGKSTLIEALRQRGVATVPEPGRRVAAEEQAQGGTALPWIDMAAFARRAAAMAEADYDAALAAHGRVVFDRGLVDAVAALLQGVPDGEPGTRRGWEDRLERRRYGSDVFLTPPWPEIYGRDAERRHGFSEAVAEYERLAAFYPSLGYRITILPLASVEERVALVEDRLATR